MFRYPNRDENKKFLKPPHSGLIFLKVIPERGWPWKLKTPGGIAFKPILIYKIHETYMKTDHFLFGIIHIGRNPQLSNPCIHYHYITYVKSTWCDPTDGLTCNTFPKCRRAAFHLLIFIGVFFGLSP